VKVMNRTNIPESRLVLILALIFKEKL
jgi:hypothetical protein